MRAPRNSRVRRRADPRQLSLLAGSVPEPHHTQMNTGVRSKTEPAFCSKSSKRCSTRSIRECYQMVVVGQNILTGCHFGRGSARFQEQLPESDSQTARLRADTV